MNDKLFVGQDSGSAKLITKAFTSNAKRLAKLREQEEEDRIRREAEQASQELINSGIKSGTTNQDGSEKDIFQKAGDIAKAAPGALWEGLTSSYKRIGEGTGEVIGEITGANQQIRDAHQKASDENRKTMKLAAEKMKDLSLPEAKRAEWRKIFEKEAKDNSANDQARQYAEEQIEKTDPTKAAGAMASIGLDIVTAGALKAATTGAKLANASSKTTKAISAVNKITNPTGLKQGAASGAVLGTAYGGIGAVEEKGDEVTAGDVIGGAALGAGLGGILGGAVGGIGTGFAKLRAAKNPEEAQKITDEIVQETRAKQEGQLQLGAGYRTPEEIQSDIAAVQNGEDASLFTYTDTAGNDVTSQVADFDKEIRARQTAIRDLQQQADGIDNNTGEATIPEGVDPSEYAGDTMARANAAEAVSKLEQEIADLTEQQSKAFDALGGVNKQLDPDAAKAKFQSLQEELATASEYQNNVRTAATREEAQAIDVKALEKEEADLKAGIVPDEMLKPFATVKSADDVRAMMLDVDPQDTKGFIKGADEITRERMYLEAKMNDLYTDDKYEEAKLGINEGYNAAMQETELLPEPIRVERQAEINEQVLRDYDEIEQMREMDSNAIAEVQQRMDEMDQLEQAMLQETRAVQLSDPDLFRPIDNEAVANRLTAIQHQKFLASEAPDPIVGKEILTKTTETGGNVAELAKTDPVVAKAVDTQIETQANSILDNTGKTAGLGWIIGTPTRVIEKFGATGKQVSEILRNAVNHKEQLDGEFEYQMAQWGRLISGKDATEKVAKALDGDADALNGLSASQKQAYTEIKDWFKNRADEMGLPEDARVKDYLPHLFEGKEFDHVERTLAILRAGKLDGKDLTPKQRERMENDLAGIDAQTLGYLASKNTYIAKNGFLKKRKGAKDYSLDLEKILTAYHSASSSTIAYKPAVAEANKLTPALTKEQNTYVNAVFKNLQGETDTVIEKAIDGALQNLSSMTGKNLGGEGSTSRLSRGARSAIYNATIGANVGSAIRNSQQMVNVYAEVGASGVLEAAPRALAALKKNSPMREMLYKNGVLSNRQGSYLQGGAMPKFKDKGTAALWGMFNTTETLNRATAFFAGYDKHLAKFPGDTAGAEKAGAALAQKTNFKFSAIDIPVAMQGDMAKNFLQMQTYNIQQTQFIGSMLKDAGVEFKDLFKKNSDGKFEMKFEAQAKLARFIGGNAAFFGTVGAATGMNWQEAIPFWSDVKAGEAPRSPMTQILFGDNKGQPGIVGTIGSGVGAVFTGKWDQAGEDVDALARSAARVLLPGGNQAVKTIEGAASATSGLSTTGSGITDTIDKGLSALSGQNPNGNIRFAQGDDAWSKFKATVLGQYATEAGRDWVDDGMKNVPTNMEINGMKASDYIKQLPRAAQEQYVSYYSNKGQAKEALEAQFGPRTTFKSDLVSQLREGSINYVTFSERMKEYNNAVSEQMGGYLAGNDRMPARLRDDMLQNLFIPVESPESYKPRKLSVEAVEEELEYTEDDYNW